MFLDLIVTLPKSHDAERATRGFENLEERAQGGDPVAGLADLLADQTARQFLNAVLSNSPYLSRSIVGDVTFLVEFLTTDPEHCFQSLLHKLATLSRDDDLNDALFMSALRKTKRRVALLIAACDIVGIWQDDEVTKRLSDFADAAVSSALDRLLRIAAAKGDLKLQDLESPGRGAGLVLLALGKHGGRELNYSSDIDFVAFFDDQTVPYQGRKTPQALFIRMLQTLVKYMQEITADGYVLRTDLRLRPDPGVTPIVISMTAAENYYESMGQNWERAAWIKARPIAGDLRAGDGFIERLQPFIWRRNLDFAAIEDVHSIKRQIHSHRGFHEVAVAGHNVKVGRGGIRDIEFFVQTQQLIAGGRDPDLRQRGTIEAMTALSEKNWIDPQTVATLTKAYHFHRRVEHRLQMINDEQTHSIGDTAAHVTHLAHFLGYGEAAAFEEEMLGQLRNVQDHYAALFETGAPLSGEGNLVFTGTDPDPDTLKSLEQMGFEDAGHVLDLVRAWHHGRYNALRTSRSREILTRITPGLLTAFAETAEPDRAITRFDKFLYGLPAGIQLFSMLQAHPDLMALLADLMGNAPRLEEYISRNPQVLDAVIAGDFLAPQPPLDDLRRNLRGGMQLARDLQEALDVTRRFAKERKFQLGVQSLKSFYDADTLGRGYADLAEAAILELYPKVLQDFAERERRGYVKGAELAILAMGKFGSREMTATSDLDMVFIYDFDGTIEASDGERPLHPTQYFARLCQRLLNAITAPTGEGTLYEVDMRLRPSGNKGPVATQFQGFIDYHEKEAWTWEHMALTRARVLASDGQLAGRIEDVLAHTLQQPRDPATVKRDAAEMRNRIFSEHGSEDPWDLKHVRGGLVDLEFICQVSLLLAGSRFPEVIDPHNRTALSRLGEVGVFETEIAEELVAASMLLSTLSAFTRVAIRNLFDPTRTTTGLAKAISQAGGAEGIDDLQEKLVAAQAFVRQIFSDVVGLPPQD